MNKFLKQWKRRGHFKIIFYVEKTIGIGHILRGICLIHVAIEGQMTEMKGVGRRRRNDDLRKRRYWQLKEQVEDRNRWKR
jgi:hypothetical protein